MTNDQRISINTQRKHRTTIRPDDAYAICSRQIATRMFTSLRRHNIYIESERRTCPGRADAPLNGAQIVPGTAATVVFHFYDTLSVSKLDARNRNEHANTQRAAFVLTLRKRNNTRTLLHDVDVVRQSAAGVFC